MEEKQTAPALTPVSYTHLDVYKRQTLRGLWATLKDIFGHKSIFVFMLAYFFYIDGVGTILHMSKMCIRDRSMAPSMRIGYMVLPVPVLEMYRAEYGVYSSTEMCIRDSFYGKMMIVHTVPAGGLVVW